MMIGLQAQAGLLFVEAGSEFTFSGGPKWHGLAKALSEHHSGDCYFYLGHVGSGRIETDILNHLYGHLTRDDLDVALMMNELEDDVKMAAAGPQP
jgi:hypothetical protein